MRLKRRHYRQPFQGFLAEPGFQPGIILLFGAVGGAVIGWLTGRFGR